MNDQIGQDSGNGRIITQRRNSSNFRDKIVLLVTHQLQYAKEADSICMISRGEVKAMGTLAEIRDVLDEDFSDFMKEDDDKEEHEEKSPDEDTVEQEPVQIPNGSEVKGEC